MSAWGSAKLPYEDLPSDSIYSREQWLAIKKALGNKIRPDAFPIISRLLYLAAAKYLTRANYDHPELNGGKKFKSNENKKALENSLAAFHEVKKFLSHRMNQMRLDRPERTLSFSQAESVHNAAITEIERELKTLSKRGPESKMARNYLIKELKKIWREYTREEPSVSLAQYGLAQNSPFVEFAKLVAEPVLIPAHKAGFESALRQN